MFIAVSYVCISTVHDLYVYSFHNLQACGDDCDLPVVTLTDDRDEQNDAVNGRLQILQSQLLQLDDYCSAEGTVIDTPPSSTLCETVQSELQQLTQKIAVYVRMHGKVTYLSQHL